MTKEECKGITHHLLSIIDPIPTDPKDNKIQQFNSQRFVSETDGLVNTILCVYHLTSIKIKSISKKNMMPIIVGGTHHYIESLLFHGSDHVPLDDSKEDETDETMDHARLQELDPEMAEKLHPNQKRKIQRSIQVSIST